MKIRMIISRILLIMTALLVLTSCEKNPISKLQDPTPDGAINSWNGVLKIYDEDLRTGGNVEFIPSDFDPPDNTMAIDFKDSDENAPQGVNCMKYSWNGKDVIWTSPLAPPSGLEHTFGGVTLIVATHFTLYNSTPGRDLRAGGYTHISFKAKAVLGRGSDAVGDTTVKFEGPTQEASGVHDFIRLNRSQISEVAWQEYSIPLATTDLGNVKDYFKIVIEWHGADVGEGGTVFVDDLRYER